MSPPPLNFPPIPSYIHTQSPELALICCEISGAMSSSRVKKFQEIQKIMPQRQVSMNEIRIDKLAFTFKKTICHYYILLYKIFQEARRRIKTTALLLKLCASSSCKKKKISNSVLINSWVRIPALTVVTLQLRYTDLISFIA